MRREFHGHKKIIQRSRETVVILLVIFLIFVFVEGLSSASISLYQMLSYTSPPAISRHDELIGWTGIPNTYIPNMYGPGKYVRTNSLGFRNDKEVEAALSDTRIRIICSGDSFTYGEGVANNQAWCNRMPALDNRLETVNLAQPGYGVDQMYLRYMRDGTSLERSIHIFAFIVGDLSRMGFLDQHQYGKPILKIENETLVADNVPVPQHRWSASRLLSKADFQTVELIKRLSSRLFRTNEGSPDLIKRLGPVAENIYQTIQQQDEKNNVVPVFVFLPTERDLERDHSWHRWTVQTMDKLGLHFIDLTASLRALPAGEAGTFFIAPGKQAEGHYTEAGNKWVTETLYKQIRAIPQISAMFSGTKSPATEVGSGQPQ